jgi:hypothetical protein
MTTLAIRFSTLQWFKNDNFTVIRYKDGILYQVGRDESRLKNSDRFDRDLFVEAGGNLVEFSFIGVL